MDIDIEEDSYAEIQSILKQALKGKRNGIMCMCELDALKNLCCSCCHCVLAEIDGEYCLDCKYEASREDIKLILFILEYTGNYDCIQYQSKIRKMIDRWTNSV